jgi:RNA polymerase sigma factor (sigma-70 family)
MSVIGAIGAHEMQVTDIVERAGVEVGSSWDEARVEQNESPVLGDIQSASVADLVGAASAGDQLAWNELFSRYSGMIASVGRRHGLSAADVSELQQTTWLRLVENFDRIRQPERVGGWLANTARRESLQLLRRAARYTAGADQMLANMPNVDVPELDAGPLAEERDAVVRRAWSKLKPRCQEMLSLLLRDDSIAYKDLSRMLNVPVGSIGPTRGRCLEHLRRLVEEEGLTTADQF